MIRTFLILIAINTFVLGQIIDDTEFTIKQDELKKFKVSPTVNRFRIVGTTMATVELLLIITFREYLLTFTSILTEVILQKLVQAILFTYIDCLQLGLFLRRLRISRSQLSDWDESRSFELWFYHRLNDLRISQSNLYIYGYYKL